MRVETELKIPAPPIRVWSALTDFPAYTKWNPFRAIVGSAELGAKVTLLVGPNPQARHKLKAKISVLVPGREIGFLSGRKLLGMATETFSIEPSGKGTLLRHSATMSGLSAFLMARTGAADELASVYKTVDRALRTYCTTPALRSPSQRSVTRRP